MAPTQREIEQFYRDKAELERSRKEWKKEVDDLFEMSKNNPSVQEIWNTVIEITRATSELKAITDNLVKVVGRHDESITTLRENQKVNLNDVKELKSNLGCHLKERSDSARENRKEWRQHAWEIGKTFVTVVITLFVWLVATHADDVVKTFYK